MPQVRVCSPPVYMAGCRPVYIEAHFQTYIFHRFFSFSPFVCCLVISVVCCPVPVRVLCVASNVPSCDLVSFLHVSPLGFWHHVRCICILLHFVNMMT